MTLYPCSGCDQRPPGKLCSATWAWFRADDERVAYRQRLCVQCYVERVAVLEVQSEADRLNCPCCGSEAGSDMDPCYLTVFVPGIGPIRHELATCASCAVQVRQRAQENAVKLEQRPVESGGQGPGPQTGDPDAAWAALGITPRER